MKGRKPKPTSAQISAGDPRKHGKQKLEQKLANEPSATHGLPDCPKHLKGRARAAWGFWAAELADMNLDYRADAMVLEGACINYAAFIGAYEKCLELGDVIEDLLVSPKTGEVVGQKLKKNPWVEVRNNAATLMKGFCSELGLSNASRPKLRVERSDRNEDLMAILSKPRPTKEREPSLVQ